MKQYTPASQLPCEHYEGVDDKGDPIPVPCPGLCPKLVILSTNSPGYPNLGPKEPHGIAFAAQEVRTFIRETDKGFFDLPDMPPRKESRFWDPLTAMLMEALQDNPVRALGILLYLGMPEAIAFTTGTEPVLALRDIEGGWLWIHLSRDPTPPIVEEAEGAIALVDDGGAAVDDIDIPQPVTYHDVPPAGAHMLWERPTPQIIEGDHHDSTDDRPAAPDA